MRAARSSVVADGVSRVLVLTIATRPPGLDDLSDRELDVLRLVARGRSNDETAGDLFIVEATVKTHVGRIFSKLGVRDRAQAVVVAYESGLGRAVRDRLMRQSPPS